MSEAGGLPRLRRPCARQKGKTIRIDLCDSLYLPKDLYDLDFRSSGLDMSTDRVMQSMRNLSSCMCWHNGQRKPVRMLEEPDPEQAEILAALGYEIKSGVLQG